MFSIMKQMVVLKEQFVFILKVQVVTQIFDLKCVVNLKEPYICRKSIQEKIQEIVSNTYFAAQPKTIFTSSSLVIPNG